MDRTTSRVRRHAQSPGPLPLADAFRDQLSDADIDRAVAAEGIRFRRRLWTPATTVRTFFAQVFHAGASCRQALIRLGAARPAAATPATGGYCKARRRLTEGLLDRLARTVADRAAAAAPGRWKGLEVKIVDGTAVSMPDTEANRAAYPPPRSQAPGVGFPLARLVAVVALATGCVRRAALAPWRGRQTGEGSLLAGMLGEFRAGDLLLGDAAFTAYWLLASLAAGGVPYLGAVGARRRRTDYRRGRRLGPADRLEVWRRPDRPAPGLTPAQWAALPATLAVRRLRLAVARPGFRVRVLHLATTLVDAARHPKPDLADLYRRRWQVELHFRALKNDLKLGVLRCKTPAMVRAEAAMHRLVYNAIRAVMARAGVQAARAPYRLSFTAAREAIEAYAPRLADPAARADALDEMLRLIGSQVVDDRPNRVEPRVVKRRPKNCKLMTKPRHRYPRVTTACV